MMHETAGCNCTTRDGTARRSVTQVRVVFWAAGARSMRRVIAGRNRTLRDGGARHSITRCNATFWQQAHPR
jgi:hypothetical protein